MPRLGERLAVQQVLFIEIDLREVLTTELHFHPAGGAGGVAAALVVQRKSQFLRGFEQRQVGRHLAAFPLRMKKRHPRHQTSPSRPLGDTGGGRVIWTPPERQMLPELLPEQAQSALVYHRRARA